MTVQHLSLTSWVHLTVLWLITHYSFSWLVVLTFKPGIRTPIVLAPMAFTGGGLLADQVSQAGGFGFMAPRTAYIIAKTRSLEVITPSTFAAQSSVKISPTGKNDYTLLARPSHPSRTTSPYRSRLP